MHDMTFAVVAHTRTNKDGSRPIYLRVTFRRRKWFFNLGLSVQPHDWSKESARYLRGVVGAKENNDYLRTVEQRCSDYAMSIKREGTVFNVERLKAAVFAPAAPILSRTVCDLASEIMAKNQKEGRIGNAEVYRWLRRAVEKVGDATLAVIDAKWIASFELFMQRAGNKPGTVALRMARLNAVCRYAILEHGAPMDWNPFLKYRGKAAAQDTGSRALSLEDFRRIESVVPENRAEELILDLFRLSFYTWGANMADLVRLKKSNIVAGRIEYVREKTRRTARKLYSVPISPEVAKILAKYEGSGDYLLPVLSQGEDEAQARRRIMYLCMTASKALRAMAKRAGVDSANLSFYSARHTVATSLSRKGVGVTVIRDMLGHTSTGTTEVYIKKHSRDTLDDAAAMLLE